MILAMNGLSNPVGEVAASGTFCRVIYALLTIKDDLVPGCSRDELKRDEKRDTGDADLRGEWSISGIAVVKRQAIKFVQLFTRRYRHICRD